MVRFDRVIRFRAAPFIGAERRRTTQRRGAA
jgi:hypothetical protein